MTTQGLIFNNLFILFTWICVWEWPCVYGCLQRPEEAIRFRQSGHNKGCEPLNKGAEK